jgi:uncharacterized SAM-dependent methyltransferase
MKIEILLTESEIASEFAEALQARDLPEKFFYWFPLSVATWNSLATGPEYAGLRSAWDALGVRSNWHAQEWDSDVPVVSFGAGDGTGDRVILRAIRAAGKTPRYFPVDASQTLLESACSAAEDEEFETTGIKADISSRMHLVLAADAAEAPRLFLMAGNTLGGFDPIEQVSSIADCMRSGDRLIIDGELDHGDEPVTAASDAARAFAFSPLASIGLAPEDGRIRFEQKHDNRHEGLCMLTRYFHADRDLRFSVFSTDITIARGERILMNFRYLYKPKAFRWLLEHRAGLEVEENIVSEDGRFITAVCKKE